MRTTLTIDDDILLAAKTLAEQRRVSIGTVISQLARDGLNPDPTVRYEIDIPVFDVREGASIFGPDDVDRVQEET